MNKLLARCSLSLLGGLLAAVPALAQQDSAGDKWEVPRTSAGRPVLQGYWTSTTVVPFERSEELGEQAYYSPEEAGEILQRSLQSSETQRGTQADVHYQFEDYGLSRGQNAVVENLRTSILTDPADGRMPPLLPAAREIGEQRRAYRQEHGFDSAQDRPLSERCIVWSNEGPPMLPLGYNSNYQIMQTADHVVVLLEMIHDARIIPLTDTMPDTATVPQWLGNSWGRWEGDTLVVETTGFTGDTTPRGSNAPLDTNARVIERFQRTGPGTLSYSFTVSDPTLWESSWSGEYPMTAIDAPMFEYACHEGNYGLSNNLSGARAEEREAARQ